MRVIPLLFVALCCSVPSVASDSHEHADSAKPVSALPAKPNSAKPLKLPQAKPQKHPAPVSHDAMHTAHPQSEPEAAALPHAPEAQAAPIVEKEKEDGDGSDSGNAGGPHIDAMKTAHGKPEHVAEKPDSSKAKQAKHAGVKPATETKPQAHPAEKHAAPTETEHASPAKPTAHADIEARHADSAMQHPPVEKSSPALHPVTGHPVEKPGAKSSGAVQPLPIPRAEPGSEAHPAADTEKASGHEAEPEKHIEPAPPAHAEPAQPVHGEKAVPMHGESGHDAHGKAVPEKHGSVPPAGTPEATHPVPMKEAHPAHAEKGNPAHEEHPPAHGSAAPPAHEAPAHTDVKTPVHGEAHPVKPEAKPSGHEDSHPAHGEAAQEHGHEPVGHEATQEHGHEDAGHGSAEHGEGEAPAMAPHPDTAFASAVDWEKGTAEILDYAVKRTGIAGETRCRGKLVTERMFVKTDGAASRQGGGKGDVDVLNATLSVAGEAGAVPFSVETITKLPRKGPFGILRQDQSLQGWPGSSHRALDCRVVPPRLRILSSGGEPARDTVLARWPVYTEEMLFTYLRALPQRAGYREEVWLQDWGAEGRFALKPQYASIAVRSKAPAIRDQETWYVTVDRNDGRRSEFWISASGLHPVVVALLVDGSEWTLQGTSRKKYWSW